MAQNANNTYNTNGIPSVTVFMNYNDKFVPKFCRICLLIVKDNLHLFSIESIKLKIENVSLYDKLYNCCPELNLRIESKILCGNCFDIINIISEFIRKYEKTKSHVYEYIPFLSSDGYKSTGQEKIKIEEVDIPDSEKDILNKFTQNQNITKTFKGLQSNFISSIQIKPFNCFFCGYSCTTKTALKKHLCEYTITTKNDLKISMKSHTAEKSFRCSVCNYSCIRKNYLSIHMRTHTGEKPFKCSLCNYNCITNERLKSHMNIHTGVKPFSCTACNYSCTERSNLRRHMKIHTGEKPYKCSVCSYSCITNSRLKKHMKIHSEEKSFSCSICDYSCIRNRQLKKHMKIHIGRKSFRCSVCSYTSIKNSRLKMHMNFHVRQNSFSFVQL